MITDAYYYIAAFFFLAIALIAGFLFVGNFDDALQSSNLDADAKASFSGFSTRFPSVMDALFLTLFIGVFLVAVGLVWFLDINPLIFFVIIFAASFLVVVAGAFGDAWALFGSDPNVSAAVTQLPITNFLLSNFMIIGAILIGVLVFVFFAKPKEGGYA